MPISPEHFRYAHEFYEREEQAKFLNYAIPRGKLRNNLIWFKW